MSSPGAESFDVSTAKLKPDTVAIVTGAAMGLGKGFAQALLLKGAKGVCLSDVDETNGQETLREFTNEFGKDRVIFVKCDVTLPSDLEAVFAVTKDTFGTVNLMVNNAGMINEMNPDRCVDVNVKGVITGTHTALHYMDRESGGKGGKIINISSMAGVITGTHTALHYMDRESGGKGGKIINISSMAGLLAVYIMPVYAATKHAVVGFTKSLAADPRLQAKGITFGILCPTFANTSIIVNPPFRHPDEDKIHLDTLKETFGVLEVSEVRDAFLRLVLDESWTGKVMTLTKEDGIGSA